MIPNSNRLAIGAGLRIRDPFDEGRGGNVIKLLTYPFALRGYLNRSCYNVL